MFWSEYKNKKNTLLSYFFANNPNMKSELENSDFQNFTLLFSFRAIQGPVGTLRAQNWALRPLPSF